MNLEIGPGLAAWLAALIPAAVGILTLWITQRAGFKKQEKATDTIHDLVNSRHTKALEEIAVLQSVIKELIHAKSVNDRRLSAVDVARLDVPSSER